MKLAKGTIFLLIGIALLVSGWIALIQEKQINAMKQEQKNIEVSLKEYSIGSGKIHLIPSENPIKITIQNKGASAHDFVIKDLGIDSGIISPGESVTLEIDAKDQTVLQAECTLPGHKEAGMLADVIIR